MKQIISSIQKLAPNVASFVVSASTPDRVGDTIAPSELAKYVGREIIALFQHDHSAIVGAFKNLRMQGDQLIGDLVTASTDLGKSIQAMLDEGIPLSASIGFSAKGSRNDKGGIHYDRELDLHEISIVAVPAQQRAIRIAKQFNTEFLIEGQSSADDHDKAESGDINAIIAIATAKRLKAKVKRVLS